MTVSSFAFRSSSGIRELFFMISILACLPSTVMSFSPLVPSTRTRTTTTTVTTSSDRRLTRTNLSMVKRSERAFIEKNLEDAMNNDWREFRAKLVANEKIVVSPGGKKDKDKQNQSEKNNNNNMKKNKNAKDNAANNVNSSNNSGTTTSSSSSSTTTTATATTTNPPHKLQNKKGTDLGDMFADAISSIFPKNSKSSSLPDNKNANAIFHHNNNNNDDRIFDGDSVGGLPDLTMIEDPFCSHDELPILWQPKMVAINKHRWAHTIPNVEPGCVLVANEKLGGVFHQTVVLIIDHCESQGSTGIIINRPLKGNLQDVASAQNTTLDLSLKLAFSKSPVTYGGPVNSNEFSILHGFGQVEGARKLAPGIFVGGSEELMNGVRINRLEPQQALFVKGHAAWVAGQLSREIAKGVWYPASVSSNLILRYAGAPVTDADDPADLWSDIMHCLGEDFVEIARANAGRGDRRMMP